MEASTRRAADTERRKSVTRFFDRVRTSLRRSSRTSASGPSTVPVTASAEDKENQKPMVTTPLAEESAVEDILGTVTAMRSSHEPAIIEADTEMFNDRTAMLLAKYNLDFIYEPPRGRAQPQERIHKPIRMRVRYTCHRCQTSFGHEKECSSCQHRRCTKCDRFPPKKTREQKAARAAVATPDDPPVRIEATDKACACHMCQTDILNHVEECPNCHHRICDQCLKEAQLDIS